MVKFIISFNFQLVAGQCFGTLHPSESDSSSYHGNTRYQKIQNLVPLDLTIYINICFVYRYVHSYFSHRISSVMTLEPCEFIKISARDFKKMRQVLRLLETEYCIFLFLIYFVKKGAALCDIYVNIKFFSWSTAK